MVRMCWTSSGLSPGFQHERSRLLRNSAAHSSSAIFPALASDVRTPPLRRSAERRPPPLSLTAPARARCSLLMSEARFSRASLLSPPLPRPLGVLTGAPAAWACARFAFDDIGAMKGRPRT